MLDNFVGNYLLGIIKAGSHGGYYKSNLDFFRMFSQEAVSEDENIV